METQASAVISAIVIISSIFVLVAVFVITYLVYFNRRKTRMLEENQQMKENFQTQLLQSRIEVQEETFQQIGKELHDNVGQLLSTSRMLIGLTERGLTNPPDTLLTANATLGQAINEIRSLSKSLDKEWLEQFSFQDNIRAVIDRINAGNLIEVSLEQTGILPFRSDEQIILFRIVQEAIQNAIKHASPTNMRISLQCEEHFCKVIVSDNGCGFDVSNARGMGFTNMRNRTQLLGGTMTFNSILGQGTTLSIHLPVKNRVA